MSLNRVNSSLRTDYFLENMHYFIQEVAQQELGAMQGFLRRAQAIYDDNLSAYVKIVLRRPMGKILVCTSIIEQGT